MSIAKTAGRKYLFSVNDHIGDFTVISTVGYGSYGEVYYVSDPLGTKFALKVILEDISDTAAKEINGVSLLRKQIRTEEALPQIYHVGRINDLLYYTMDAADNCSNDQGSYIPDTLQRRIENRQIFSAEEILDIAESLLISLRALHQHDLVHRDIKPSNIIFLQGKCMLTDFGLISANPKTFIGSPGFLAPCPEGGVNLQNQKAADLYSIGKIIYCLFSGKSVDQFPLLPEKFSIKDFSIIHSLYQKACAAEPGKRFKSCEEFHTAVMNAKSMDNNKKIKPIFIIAGILSACLVIFLLLFAGLQIKKSCITTANQDIEEINVSQTMTEFPQSQEVFVKIFEKNNGYQILVCFTHTSERDADPLYRPNQFKAMGFVKQGMANYLRIDKSQKIKIKYIRYLRQPFTEGSLMVYMYFINKKDCKAITTNGGQNV